MLITITGEYSYYTGGTVDIPIEQLDLIGIEYKFDVANNTIVKIEKTAQQLYQQEYDELKQQLSNMDYKTSKYVDGEYTESEWQEIVSERKQIRIRVRELETLLKGETV